MTIGHIIGSGTRARGAFLGLPLVLLMACSGKSSSEDTTHSGGASNTTGGTEETTDTDTSDTDIEDTGGFPAQPDAFTVMVEGTLSQSITFDMPDCSHRTGSTTFRQFWRGQGHVFVLLVEMFDTFPGETGAYDASQGVRVRLQEEAGGSGAYFDSTLGSSSATMTLDGFDTDAGQAWGAFSAGTLGDGAGGSVTLSPDTLPVWCASLE